MDAATLYDAIETVCPVISTTCLDPEERETWSYVAPPTATPEQLAAADNVIATIPIAVAGSASLSEFLGRWTNAEYVLLEKKRAADVAVNKVGNAKNWDVVIASDVIKFDKQKVQTLKADLVSDGILTQERADEIFR